MGAKKNILTVDKQADSQTLSEAWQQAALTQMLDYGKQQKAYTTNAKAAQAYKANLLGYASLGVQDPTPIFFDRSRHETGLNCKRLRYHTYHEDGTGYSPASGSLPLIFGNAMHQGMASLLTCSSAQVIWAIQSTVEDFSYNLATLMGGPNFPEHTFKEQAWTLEVLLHLWAATERPKYVNDHWRITAVEKEFTVAIGNGVNQMVRLDAIVQRKADGYYFVLEHKTTSGFSQDWFELWNHNLQVILNYNACQHQYGNCGGVIISGINKGKREKDKSHVDNSDTAGLTIQNSILAYAWASKVSDTLSTVYKPGAIWRKVPMYNHGMSAENWAKELLHEPGIVTKLFATTEALAPPDHLIQDTLAQVVEEELDYHNRLRRVKKHGLVSVPRNMSQCHKYGAPCVYRRYCYSAKAEQQHMLQSGELLIRAPHHATEVDKMGEDVVPTAPVEVNNDSIGFKNLTCNGLTVAGPGYTVKDTELGKAAVDYLSNQVKQYGGSIKGKSFTDPLGYPQSDADIGAKKG